MRQRLAACLLLGSLLVASLAAAQDEEYPWAEKRELFRQARQALADGDKPALARLKPKLADYPLYAYIEYTELATSFYRATPATIDAFFATHQEGPATRRLRYFWLEHLRRRDDWRTFRHYYRPEVANTEQQCYYQLANYRAGDKAAALAAGVELWTVGESQPKGCDDLFALLIKDGAISEEVAWRRYSQAVLNHEYQLAAYLKRFFTTAPYQRKAEAYLRVDQAPASIVTGPVDSADNPANRDIIVHGITHLARNQPRDAYRAWERFSPGLSFSEDQQGDMLASIVRGFARNGLQGNADDVLRRHGASIPLEVFEWRLRNALAEQDWPTVHFWITNLPEEGATEPRWRYWLARADEALAVSGDDTADRLYREVARERDFYGYLAAQKLALPYQLNHRKAEPPADVMAQARANPALIRCRELYHVGEIVEAKREWAFAGEHFGEAEWIAAANLATEWGWHNRAIQGLIAAKFWDDTVQRFPVVYREVYLREGKKFDLPAPILAAITRQESAYDPMAVSSSDARGLMQLLPSTAKYIADKRDIRYRGTASLFQPEVNIRLGTAYYRYLMDQFDDNRILSTAGYNAGPNRAKQWLKASNGQLPPDIWIETIPFTETRKYVMNVLTYAVIYSIQSGQPQDLLTAAEWNRMM